MVFRKPYAFLIKHFRLIHLIITGLLVYIVSNIQKIYSFILSCISDQVNRYNALDYINYNIYIYLGIGIVLFIIIYWLFKYKDKPRNVYIISILGYITLGIYLFLLYSYLVELPNNIIDAKSIRAFRDITLMSLIFQYIIIIIMFIRGLGFDVKKFNFTKDIHELNITNEDGDEVEVAVNVNTDAIMRGVRKQKREFGYFFQEYKLFILVILTIIIVSIGYFGYNYVQKKNKVYNQNEFVGYNNYISVKKGYYDIGKGKYYIIVSFDIYKYGVEEKFNISNLKLMIDNKEYIPNKNICYNYDDIGTCYKKQYINEDVKNYIVTYEIDSLNIEKSYLVYKETYENSFKIKLNLENYD